MTEAPSYEFFGTLKRILRNRSTGLFFTGSGWSQDPVLAQVFSKHIEAVRTCVEFDLANVELVCRTDLHGADFFSTPIR